MAVLNFNTRELGILYTCVRNEILKRKALHTNDDDSLFSTSELESLSEKILPTPSSLKGGDE